MCLLFKPNLPLHHFLYLHLAASEGDPLLVNIFHNAGVQLGKHDRALLPNIEQVRLPNQNLF